MDKNFQSLSCWCQNQEFTPFSDFYRRCTNCGTLVSTVPLAKSGEKGKWENFYGQEYWFAHQKDDLHQPDIIERSRADLSGCCLHWLRTVLGYKLPPVRSLELGSAHGGFVSLMKWSGYEASGLEINPWVVEFARETFKVPVLLGPLQDQAIEEHSLDIIILMDVLEHLPEPLEVLRHCLPLLKPDGIFVIQTPCFPEGKNYEDLVAEENRFTEMLLEREHLFLFSYSSIRYFFHRLGVEKIVFEPAIFPQYDMFLVASRSSLEINSPEEIEKTLRSLPGGRMILALLDLDAQKKKIFTRYMEAEADRAARLQTINLQNQKLESLPFLFTHVPKILLYHALRKLGFAYLTHSKISSRQAPIAWESDSTVEEAPPNSTATGEIRLSRVVVDLTPLLPGAENGGAKIMTMELIRYLHQLMAQTEFYLLTSEKNHDELSCLEAPNVHRVRVAAAHKISSRLPLSNEQMRRIRLQLQEKLASCLPHSLYLKVKALNRTLRMRRTSLYLKIKALDRALRMRRTFSSGIVRELGADLLFCPFTVPFFYDPTIPAVSVVYDLQYQYYPQFFDRDEHHIRERNFKDTTHLADSLVCISEFVRQTVLKNSNFPPDRVVTIPIRLPERIRKPAQSTASSVLRRYGLHDKNFLLYPANFWPHKNHAMLFTSFGMYRFRHPDSSLALVCTGFPDPKMESFTRDIQRMGLGAYVFFPGFLPEEEFAALLYSCRALIFPSLYEGFGMPLLEAMAFGKPILCSNLACLPEVAGEAAFYFDPRKPQEILSAIETLESNPAQGSRLVELGYQRLAGFGDGRKMAEEYQTIFSRVLRHARLSPQVLHGVYSDGWTKDRIFVMYPPSQRSRILEIIFEIPPALPYKRVLVSVFLQGAFSQQSIIKRGNPEIIRLRLPRPKGILEFMFEPRFQPKAFGINEDDRWLGCICRGCSIISDGQRENLFLE